MIEEDSRTVEQDATSEAHSGATPHVSTLAESEPATVAVSHDAAAPESAPSLTDSTLVPEAIDSPESAEEEQAAIADALAGELFVEEAPLEPTAATIESDDEIAAGDEDEFADAQDEDGDDEDDDEAPEAALEVAPAPLAATRIAEPNLFSDEPGWEPAAEREPDEIELAARAFWDEPDANPRSPSPAGGAITAAASSHGGSSAQGANPSFGSVGGGRPAAQRFQPPGSAQQVDAEGDRRRRRRRRRRGRAGSRVETELPIDTPQMVSVVERLRRQFGLKSFRPGQERVIRNVLDGRDTLAVMPTGSGKSLTFQLPAMVLDGVTLVVSPLLALMKDQTDKLKKRGVLVARLDSTLTTVGEREMLKAIEGGQHKLVYVTPERASSSDFKEELGGNPVKLFVVDEAHCVSQWGHDFRPAYLNLRRAIDELGRPPILALTATATPRVVEDILDRLGMREPDTVHLGFVREELAFEVRAVADEKQQVKRLLRLIRRIKGSGIIYCSTINTVEALAGALPRLGLRVGKYNGKMTKHERDFEQQRFMKNQVRVMIATNAFGLGVDKPDIRFVIHYNLPGSIEQYYQEAGRAGRDGKPARCILLWRLGDEHVQEHFNTQKYPGRDQVRAVAQGMLAGPAKVSEIALRAGVPQKKAQVVLAMLEEAHLVQAIPGDLWSADENVADEQVIWNAAEAYRKKRESDRERLQAMLDYANARRCRTQVLLGYFGQEVPPCGRCDICTGKLGASTEDDDAEDEAPVQRFAELPAAPPPPRKDPTTMF